MVQTSRYRPSLAKKCGKRQAMGPPWPSSGENVILRILLGHTVRKTQGCRSALAKQWGKYGPADGEVRKAPEQESIEGGWVHPGAAVRMASGYCSADAEVRKSGHTGTRWRDVSAVAQ
ncbi:hypothetical protein Y032_0180g765 [Ancylostoma ceylanicum]|uniref:Uncharacterized protein n=1 Tax=Ancylostoma ceylanicum TaxID=53326 RepID=A0A016ST63_9BILA|nr:hypothetical protein Y032_0180g765 [Ancylostoma ceylanicum]